MRGAKFDGRSVLKGGMWIWGAVLMCGLLLVWNGNGWSDEPPQAGGHHHHPAVAPPTQIKQQTGPVKQQPRLAVPPRWRFAIPAGDHHAGRQVFVDFECFKCHEVAGEDFPAPKAEQGNVGPALSGMGAMHPAEYFLETMIDPNASVAWRIKHHKDEKKGYLGADGKSKMPSYNETMTVQQLIDLVAYMKSLTEGGHRH
ncbi:MAG: c-type cytochrome [candidate division NC10 bacterium]|nr:c-type cytochrome [candidate division NC10 bacterium]